MWKSCSGIGDAEGWGKAAHVGQCVGSIYTFASTATATAFGSYHIANEAIRKIRVRRGKFEKLIAEKDEAIRKKQEEMEEAIKEKDEAIRKRKEEVETAKSVSEGKEAEDKAKREGEEAVKEATRKGSRNCNRKTNS